MAHNLADELLQIVLSDTLTIPDEEFRRPSTRAFARLDPHFASSSSVLLVCKRWLRVATPLLYEVVVIRSIGQAQALGDAFAQNPSFAHHVKKIRIEGAWDTLGEILKACTNIRIVFLALHIWSNDSVTGLCRGLSRINPTEVILCDDEKLYNAKLKKVIKALCEAVPKWTNLTEFYLTLMSGKPRVQAERNVLIDELQKSSSLRTVSADMPGCWGPTWSRLATNPNLNFDFYCWIWPEISIFKDSVPKDTRPRVRIMEHPSRWKNRDKRMKQKQILAPTSFTPLAYVPRALATKIWREIFAFATMPTPDFNDDTYFGRSHINSVRTNLSLVCKLFEKAVRPLFYYLPVFTNQESFALFVAHILHNPCLGPQVRVLPFNFYITHVKDADTRLRVLLPHLTNLRRFNGEGKLSFTTFCVLAQHAGEHLISLGRLNIDDKGFHESPAVWNSFKNLEELEVRVMPTFQLDKSAIEPGCLERVHTLTISVFSHNMFELFQLMAFPNLTSVRLEFVPAGPATKEFLRICGANLTDLYLWGGDRPDAFNHCPNLKSLRWRPSIDINTELLDGFESHEKLERLVLLKNLNEKTCKTEDIRDFFSTLDLSGFPHMVEFALPYYRWPREEREITRARMPRWAARLQQLYNVVLTGEAGRAWRPRVQRRR